MAAKKTVSVKVVNMAGQEVSDLKLAASVFGVTPNDACVYDAVLVELANSRQATAKTKKRGEVSGGGKKPFRQKGTGRARAGSTRSPIWVGGGTVWGPDGTQNYKLKQNRKEHQLAIKSVLSQKLADKQLKVIDELVSNDKKTKHFRDFLKALEIDEKKVLVVASEIDENSLYASLNLYNVKLTLTDNVSVYDVLLSDYVVMSEEAIKEIEEALC